ncbi:HK97 family phage major capsid protein [Paraburkholderia youngii]|uniref:phage major capsid protein n=1 Tax=Paraburkholderia youngii TaxID=2782701 RepID=UPI003D1EF43E
MEPIANQIAAAEAKRAAAQARMRAIMEDAEKEGSTFNDAQKEEFDTLERDCVELDGHMNRLRIMEKRELSAATKVDGKDGKDGKPATRSTDATRSPIITITSNLPKGTAFSRYCQALARFHGNKSEAAEFVKTYEPWKDTPQVETVLRAAVAIGNTTDPQWAAPLVDYQNLTSEFIDLLRPATLVGRITGFRNIPFNVSVPKKVSGSSVQWVGEGVAKPVSALSFDTVKMGFAKMAGIVVMTEELVRFSDPRAEALVRDDLIQAISQYMDESFIDPTRDAVAGVSPASVTFDAPTIAASGTTAANVLYDVSRLFGLLLTANMSINGAVWIMNPLTTVALYMMQNPLGQREFDEFRTIDSGLFFGLPVLTSTTVPEGLIALVLPREIMLADDGGVSLDISREASVQMSSTPTTGPAQLVSLWQQNCVGLRAERFINWSKRRPNAVAYITGAAYGGLPPAQVTPPEETATVAAGARRSRATE